MSHDTIPVTIDFDGAVIIENTIHEAKILGSNGIEFVVLIYTDDSYQTRCVDTVYYHSDQAKAALASREPL